MNQTFRDIFKNEIELEVDFGPIMRFSMERDKVGVKTFIFVEGSTDKVFYQNTNLENLSDHACYYYRTMSDKYDKKQYKGKEAVYYSLKRIIDSEKLRESLDRCQFIIDRDYMKVQKSKYSKLKLADYKKIKVTKGHSMESYFLNENNLNIVLENIGINKDDFLTVFDLFALEMSRFYAYKAVITDNFESGADIKYKKKYKDEELFVFDFTRENFWLGKDKVEEECLRMKKALRQYSYLLRQADNLQKEIAKDRIYVRGHDAFTFLEQYIIQKKIKRLHFQMERKRHLSR